MGPELARSHLSACTLHGITYMVVDIIVVDIMVVDMISRGPGREYRSAESTAPALATVQ